MARAGWILLLPILPFLPIQPAYAQSPNTSTIVVLVTDQSGAMVADAKVTVINTQTGDLREAPSGSEGNATFPSLSLTGAYRVMVSKQGFGSEERDDVTLRGGETATLRVKLLVGSEKAEVTVYGTTTGVRADPQIGRRNDSEQIDETPILGRKVSALPLLNSAFRQGKGTGDLFVNVNYFVTGGGSRRTTTYMLDGASNDEGWGRQTMIATVPVGAIQEIAVLSNAFSAEFGWTAGPALNIVTKSGTNDLHGEGLYMARPGSWQAGTFATTGFCAPSVATCVTPTTLTAINPADVPDSLNQFSGTVGLPFVKDKTFFFATADYTMQDRTTFLSPSLPSFVMPADGSTTYVGNYRQALFNGRVDHKITPQQTLMFRLNVDHFYDTNPNDAVGGTSAPSVARRYTRGSVTGNASDTWVLGPNLLNEARIGYLNGDPVTLWEAQTLSTAYTRAGSVPFTVGQSRESDLHSRQFQFSDTLSWSRGKQTLRLGTSVARHTSGGTGSEPGTASLGTFTFLATTTAPLDQLKLSDVQNYQQPINFGISSYELSQWLTAFFVQDSIRVNNDLTIDAGLRYDQQSLSDSKSNFAPRVGFGWHPRGDARTSIRGGYGMYYTQLITNVLAGYLVNGLDGLTTYTATPGQTGFPTCLTGPCLPVPLDPKTLPASQLPARDITIQAGQRDFYKTQFAKYGLNFDLLPNYPDQLVNPRSQTTTIGAEREIRKGLFLGADYVHQHWTNLARTVDLNAPSVFDRTAVGQVRTVAAANLTRPILPVNGGVRQVNVLTNLGSLRLRRPADRVQLPRQREDLRGDQLHAVERDQHQRARRQRHRAEPEHPVAAWRGRARAEPAGPAPPRGDHVHLPAAQEHHGRHGGAAGIVASVQRRHRHRQQRRRREQRPAGRQRRRHRQVGVPRHRYAGSGDVHRGTHQGWRPLNPAAAGGVQPVQPRQHPRPRPDDLRRSRDGEQYLRPDRRRRHRDQRDPGAGQHRSAADGPVSNQV